MDGRRWLQAFLCGRKIACGMAPRGLKFYQKEEGDVASTRQLREKEQGVACMVPEDVYRPEQPPVDARE